MSDEKPSTEGQTYIDEKMQIVRLVNEYLVRCDAFIDDESLSSSDREDVRAGVVILTESVKGFYKFVEDVVENEGLDPYFYNIARFFRGAIGGGMLAFRHLDMPKAAFSIAHEAITRPARNTKQSTDEERMEVARQVLWEFIDYRPVVNPYKEADAIFDSESEKKRLALLCEKRGIDLFSRSTARRRFREIQDRP